MLWRQAIIFRPLVGDLARPLFINVAFLSKKHQRPPQDKLDEKDIEESFCRGAGPGGQKINKSMNKVRLRHIPTGATVAVQEQRDLTTNRSLARKLLRDKVDLIVNGATSKIGRKISKIQKRKSKTASRAKKKYVTDIADGTNSTDGANGINGINGIDAAGAVPVAGKVDNHADSDSDEDSGSDNDSYGDIDDNDSDNDSNDDNGDSNSDSDSDIESNNDIAGDTDTESSSDTDTDQEDNKNKNEREKQTAPL